MDILKELFDLGMGTLALTQEKAEKAIKALIKKGKLEEKEGRELVEALIKRGRIERMGLEKKISKLAQRVTRELNFATKEDLRKLKKEIDQLKKHKH